MRTIPIAGRGPAAWLAAFACLALLAPSSLPARAEGTVPNPSKVLLEKASNALGEYRPWTTRVEKGLQISWDTEGWGTLKAEYTRSIKKPDKVRIDQDNSAYDHPFFRMYYLNGDDAWYMTNLTPGRNPQVTASLKTLLERADGIKYYLSACDTFFTEAHVPADTILSSVGLVRAGCVLKGDTTLFDLDGKTHVLKRRVENKGSRATIFDDYRAVGGRLVPFHVTVYDAGKKTNEFLWREVEFDVPVDDALFEENRPPAP
jgi:outer membrane lipoprotein-sorting protein